MGMEHIIFVRVFEKKVPIGLKTDEVRKDCKNIMWQSL
jgi:hypothetical protein